MRVSVICPVYNTRPDELRDGVMSTLGQEGAAVHEIILVDDASSAPATLAVLEELSRKDPRIIVLRSASNAGPATARNVGLSKASGDWVGFLDADDLWPADKLTQAAITLSNHPTSQWIVGDIANFQGDQREPVRLGVPCFDINDGRSQAQCSPALTRKIILDGLHLGTCLIDRALVADRRFDPAVLYGEDLLFLAKLSVVACARRAPGLSYLCRRGRSSMMYSPARLSDRYATGPRAGMRDRELRRFRREYRWSLYDVYKELAVNNLLNGRAAIGFRFALKALRLDPREVMEMARFLALLPVRDPADRAQRARRYCGREQVLLRKGDLV